MCILSTTSPKVPKSISLLCVIPCVLSVVQEKSSMEFYDLAMVLEYSFNKTWCDRSYSDYGTEDFTWEKSGEVVGVKFPPPFQCRVMARRCISIFLHHTSHNLNQLSVQGLLQPQLFL